MSIAILYVWDWANPITVQDSLPGKVLDFIVYIWWGMVLLCILSCSASWMATARRIFLSMQRAILLVKFWHEKYVLTLLVRVWLMLPISIFAHWKKNISRALVEIKPFSMYGVLKPICKQRLLTDTTSINTATTGHSHRMLRPNH